MANTYYLSLEPIQTLDDLYSINEGDWLYDTDIHESGSGETKITGFIRVIINPRYTGIDRFRDKHLLVETLYGSKWVGFSPNRYFKVKVEGVQHD